MNGMTNFSYGVSNILANKKQQIKQNNSFKIFMDKRSLAVNTNNGMFSTKYAFFLGHTVIFVN